MSVLKRKWYHTEILYSRRGFLLIGSLSNDDEDINESGKNAIGLISKTTILHMHQAFLYISLLSMHGYNVEVPIFSSFVEDLSTRRLSSSFPAGADPGFFLGGGAQVSCSSSTPINHKVFFLAEYQLN